MNTEQKARAWVAKVENGETGTDTYGIITALLAEHEALLSAIKEVLPYTNHGAVQCRGDKCRKPWCYSCFSEGVVEDAVIKIGQALESAQKAITLCEKEHE